MNILIVGATGYEGNAAARKLLGMGHRVRAMTRTPAKAEALRQLGAEVIQGDLRDAASLRQACAGVDKVLAAAHSLLGRGAEASHYVDDLGHKQLIDVAKTAGVQHFVYTSVHGARPDEAVPFNRTKYAIEQYLAASGLSYTILRPTAFMEWHVHTFIGQPILEKGKVTLFGQGDNPRNFVAAEDVAAFAVLGLTDPKAAGQIIEIGGPENWTNNQIVALYETLAGRPAKVTRMPLTVLRVMGPLLKPFHPGLSQAMALSIMEETTDVTFDPKATLKQFPVELTRLEAWVRGRVQPKQPVVIAAGA
ncbi:MAG: SDR family oxidoreductase [Caldilineaceae bacterium]